MKTLSLPLALLLSSLALGADTAAFAADTRDSAAPPAAESEQDSRVADSFLERLWGRDHDGEGEARHSRQGRRDDGDDGQQAQGQGGEHRADPNAADAPVPDNGVFTSKARPKVEVQ
jgi:hypothetical protein